jgi:cell shape-determining protein MreC|tara:strand:+ start:547 stop:678 length:132 start_codon:yes stop_codon:yes gene_type:complete
MINRETHRELCEKYKELEEEIKELKKRNKKLEAELSLWKGTAP